MKSRDDYYMNRCFELAQIPRTKVLTNPMVGAVIVYQDRIIGEGYHQRFGQAHAEVNAINSVAEEDRQYLPHSKIYISLEPCFHYGKTAPCVNKIIALKIPEVIISCLDPYPEVAGKSVQKLKAHGVKVTSGVLEEQGLETIAAFFNFHLQKRPYILLKYAQSQDGFMGLEDKQVWLTNAFSKRLVHKWRTEVAAIIVGTNTARLDNPKLTNRYFPGPQALRIVLDRNLSLSPQLHLFDDQHPTWIITSQEAPPQKYTQTKFIQLDFKNLIPALLQRLHQEKITHLLVEGGAQLLSSFIDQDLWDEARIFTSPHHLNAGIKAPKIKQAPKTRVKLAEDQIEYFFNPKTIEQRNAHFRQLKNRQTEAS